MLVQVDFRASQSTEGAIRNITKAGAMPAKEDQKIAAAAAALH
jgi:hypothetical protein